ncbi:UPF0149 family protein [Aliikangiella marina]|uniref:UPF0149 family protein n=1 Tax=Aliikangiella marina TaxID=1712262 RepID=UPI00163DD628|nr:UPF0149 family protein [Aliikangiella marina]
MNFHDDSGDEVSLDYEEIESILADADCEASAAEIQGFFCGMISAGAKPAENNWQDFFVDIINDGRPITDDIANLLAALYLWTAEEVNQHETLAPVLLPDDGYPVIDQLEAIIEWSQGFLLGFGLQTDNQKVNNQEVSEALADLAEICRLEHEADESEESQEALVTLIEHIKVAVQIIHWEMVAKTATQSIATDDGKPTIH